MNALNDTRSIGQVLYEATTRAPSWPSWDACGVALRSRYERAAELLVKRGFDAGAAHQKATQPPLKAREYRAQLMSERATWAAKKSAFVAALTSVADRCTKDYCGGDTPCGQCETARAALAALGDES